MDLPLSHWLTMAMEALLLLQCAIYSCPHIATSMQRVHRCESMGGARGRERRERERDERSGRAGGFVNMSLLSKF